MVGRKPAGSSLAKGVLKELRLSVALRVVCECACEMEQTAHIRRRYDIQLHTHAEQSAVAVRAKACSS